MVADSFTVQEIHRKLLSRIASARDPMDLHLLIRTSSMYAEPAHVLAALSRCAALSEQGSGGTVARTIGGELLGALVGMGLSDLDVRDAARMLWCLSRCEGAPAMREGAAVAAVADAIVR